jgi:glycosyltransferase involved in cell wall biosynthesis
VRRIGGSPVLIAGIFCLVLLIIGIYPSGPLGETIAFVFAVLWLGGFYGRRFAIRLSLVASFLAMCAFAAFRSPVADAFGDGVFVCLVVIVLSMRRPISDGRLRVLLVTRHDAERVGGTETYLRTFLRSVDAGNRDVRVVFATFDQGIVHREYERTMFATRRGGLFFRYARANEEQIVRKSLWNTIVLVATSFDLAGIAAAGADDGGVDVVYGVGGMIPNVAAILAAMALGKPVLCHFHMDFFFARFSAPLRAMLRAFFLRAQFIVANTQASIEDFVSIGYPPDRCAVVLNWVFPEDFEGAANVELRANPQEKIALFVGRLYKEKGIELVLRAFDRTPKSIRLVVAGDGALHEMVKRWTDARSQITWLGEVPHARIPALLESADCLVWGSVDRDALSLSAVEALAAGLPVIASRRSMNMFETQSVTLPNTLPPDVGVLSEPSEEAIAEAVVTVCSWDRETVRARCRSFVDRQYSPANFERLIGILETIARVETRSWE